MCSIQFFRFNVAFEKIYKMASSQSRSVVVKKFGGYDSLMVEDFELPNLDDKIEIEVKYGGLNFADLYTRQGFMMDKKLPFVLGMECTGTIKAIGSNVEDSEFKVGQRVVCYDYTGGMYRETIRVSADKCFLLPDHIDLKTGAAIFVNYLTAFFSLINLGNLKEGEKVLILSCAGGVGCAATQIVKALVKDAQVFGVGSRLKEDQAKKNGVDVFFSNDTFTEEVKTHRFDLIVTNEGGSKFSFLQDLLNPLGRIVLIGANNTIQNEQKLSIFTILKLWWTMKNISPVSLINNNRVVAGLHLGTLPEKCPTKVKATLELVFAHIKDGKLKPVIHSTWPMSEIEEATRQLAERKNVGKVLIEMGK